MLACTRLALHQGKEMSEVKRYDAGCEYAGEDEMVEREDGDYVSYSDYATLQQKLDAVLAENVALKGFFEAGINASFEGCDFFGDQMQALALQLGLIREESYRQDEHENMVVNSCGFEDGDAVYFINETPATDALLNAVRAEAIEQAAEKAPWLYGDQMGRSVEAIPKEQLIKWASQLRAETDTTPSQYESLAGGK